MSKKSKEPKILIYDIETCLNMAYLFSCGKQVVRHTQLVPGYSTWGIICITYCWNDGSDVQVIKWEPKEGTAGVIKKFDKIIKKADHSIGKNSNRFDTKMINAQRMLAGLPGFPEWVLYTDDLETQMRKYFRLPSQSLDYISERLGFGGKVPMEFSDWVRIHRYMEIKELLEKGADKTTLDIVCEHKYNLSSNKVLHIGKKAFDKMCFYGKKDTFDTRAIWNKLKEHFNPKFNMATFNNLRLACKSCGSESLRKNGTRISGKTVYQQYTCKDCYYTGTRVPLSQVKKLEGKVV